MKVRWTEGSIRFRITPGELELLVAKSPVTVELRLPGAQWLAVIRPVADAVTTIQGEQTNSMVLLLAPDDLCQLAEPSTEGVYFRLEPEGLRYYIEKDFPCIHPRPGEAAEPVTDTFAPPPGFAERR